jgi:hypothetical protein
LRRLAGEKDTLADRIDELQRGIQELERSTSDAAGAPFREAAQQLQAQQLGARMRSTARELRDGAAAGGNGRKPPQARAQAEDQLARALDDVVGTLGGGEPETRRLTQELDRTRQLRERLDQLERRVREAEANVRQSGDPQSTAARGQAAAGQPPAAGGSSARQQLQQAREEFSRELQRARETLGRSQSPPRDGVAGSTPEQHEFSRSAPGNEGFKQDFSGWDRLRKDIDLRLDRYESALAGKLEKNTAVDRLSVGGSQRVPDAYRQSVSKYFESLAKAKR